VDQAIYDKLREKYLALARGFYQVTTELDYYKGLKSVQNFVCLENYWVFGATSKKCTLWVQDTERNYTGIEAGPTSSAFLVSIRRPARLLKSNPR